MNKVVERIKKTQEHERLTDEQFATLLGIHRSTWAKVKSGERNPGLKLLRAFNYQFPNVEIFNKVSATTTLEKPQNQNLRGFLPRLMVRVFKKLKGAVSGFKQNP